MYYNIYSNRLPLPAPSPTVMAAYAFFDSRRWSRVARGEEVIGIAMTQPERTLYHTTGRIDPPPPNELPELETRVGPRG